MIPASYLFKGVYRRQWELPSAEAAQSNAETGGPGSAGHPGGLPNWAAITLALPAALQARRKETRPAHAC